jgi:hypothetical protein
VTSLGEEIEGEGLAVHYVDTDGSRRKLSVEEIDDMLGPKTSPQKVQQLLEFVSRDRKGIGKLIRPLLMIPGVSGQIRGLTKMPAEQLDGILNQTIDFLGDLRSDPNAQEGSQ